MIECLTRDGRDRSLDYKISGIFAAKGSWEAEVIDELRPGDDEIVIPKTSSSLFNSTNCEYVLRNLGIEYVMVMGMLTDQCVETAVRDGCDRGFLMTLVDDACAAYSEERHREAPARFQGLLPGPNHGRACSGAGTDPPLTPRGSVSLKRYWHRENSGTGNAGSTKGQHVGRLEWRRS